MFQMNNCATLFWNPCINVEVTAKTSSMYDGFSIWFPRVTLTLTYVKKMFRMNKGAKLLNVEVMAQNSSIDAHFIIWSSSVTFNLPEHMFQMTLLLLKEYNCAKVFLNPSLHVEVMARTISIYDHPIIWPSSVTLTFNLSKKDFKWHCYSSSRTTVPNYFEIHA